MGIPLHDIELNALRNFLDHVLTDAAHELSDIDKRNEEGFIPTYLDLEDAYSAPFERQRIAVRAVYYEINALIERSLCSAAHRPWLESTRSRGPKTLLDIKDPCRGGLRSLKMVTDLPFGEVIKLVQEYYEIEVSSLPEWAFLSELRETVNAYKHRNGLADFRKGDPDKVSFLERYEEDVDKAHRAIRSAGEFLHAFRTRLVCKDQNGDPLMIG
jgi:hypothetical protein